MPGGNVPMIAVAIARPRMHEAYAITPTAMAWAIKVNRSGPSGTEMIRKPTVDRRTDNRAAAIEYPEQRAGMGARSQSPGNEVNEEDHGGDQGHSHQTVLRVEQQDATVNAGR